MLGWIGDIERQTLDNTTFRTVVFTGEHTQLTVMSIEPGDDIGREAHHDRDQFIRIEQGTARVELSRTEEAIDETHDAEADWQFHRPVRRPMGHHRSGRSLALLR